jgi:hypothetical protein
LKKIGVNFNERQLYAFKAIYGWRDKIARLEDESLGFVLPNHMLLKIAEVLPREHQGILACCNPIPLILKQQLNELHLIILKAREVALAKVTTNRKSLPSGNMPVNYSKSSYGRHDTLGQDHEHIGYTLFSDAEPEAHIIRKPSTPSVVAKFFAHKWPKNNLFSQLNESFVTPFTRYESYIDSIVDKELEASIVKIEESAMEPITIEDDSPEKTIEDELATSSVSALISSNLKKAKSESNHVKLKTMVSSNVQPYDYSANDMKRFAGGSSTSKDAMFDAHTVHAPKNSNARDRTKKRKSVGQTFEGKKRKS